MRLGEAAVSTQNLRVHPAAIWAGQEGHNVGNVNWLTYAFQRRHLADFGDLFFTLALQKEFGCNWAGRDGIDANIASAEFVRQHMHQAFDARLRRNVWTVRRKRLGQHTAGKGDDPATGGDVLGRLRQDQERPPQSCRNDLVEQFYVALADRRKRHDSRVVDDHIDAAELLHGFFEEPLNVSLVGDICFDRNCLSPNHLDFGDDFFSLAGVAEAVHYHGEAVLCQSLGDGAADSTRRPCYDRYLFHSVPPFIPPALWIEGHYSCPGLLECPPPWSESARVNAYTLLFPVPR